jgi:hypothetical protein
MNSATPAPGLRPRFWLWLYGNGNLWGSVAGLCGMGLFFTGVIGPGWYAIVAGLYLIGNLAAPRPRPQNFALPAEFTEADAKDRLAGMRAALKAAVGDATLQKFDAMRDHALALLPKQHDDALTAEDRYTLRETVARYLPETLANYLRLPPLYRRYHTVRDGKSAEELLAGQLGLLDQGLAGMMDRVFRAEAQDLLTQGRFLEDKFHRPDLLAGTPGKA